MFRKIKPTETQSWKALIAHQPVIKKVQMKVLFGKVLNRYEKMSIKFEDILFNF